MSEIRPGIEILIDGFDHKGDGVARIDGRVIFVSGALPSERVTIGAIRKRRRHSVATVQQVLVPSAARVIPACRHFGTCGGCAMQHLAHPEQLDYKQQTLLDNLSRIGNVEPESVAPPIAATPWGYRHKARLGVRLVPKKGGVLVGFRERNNSYVTPLSECHTLSPRLASLLPELHELIAGLSIPDRIPQVEVAEGDNECALVFRHLDPLNAGDHTSLTQFGETRQLQIHVQPGGVHSVHPLIPASPVPLSYRIDEFDISIQFQPLDFTQVNPTVNRLLVGAAIKLLDPRADESILDLFCGLGNFSLPIARFGAQVTGIEREPELVERARLNAAANRVDCAQFVAANLMDPPNPIFDAHRDCVKLLLDPPRCGATEIVTGLDLPQLSRIVYVSCNPATLARDSAMLVHQHGFRLHQTGIVDMFPHTAHVESISLFER